MLWSVSLFYKFEIIHLLYCSLFDRFNDMCMSLHKQHSSNICGFLFNLLNLICYYSFDGIINNPLFCIVINNCDSYNCQLVARFNNKLIYFPLLWQRDYLWYKIFVDTTTIPFCI